MQSGDRGCVVIWCSMGGVGMWGEVGQYIVYSIQCKLYTVYPLQ